MSALCEVVARYNGIHTTHIRNEGSGVLKSLEEVLEVSRRTGVRLNVSHHKVCGRQNWGMSKETLALLDQAREEGMTVTMDVYPYLASMTKLAACIPYSTGYTETCFLFIPLRSYLTIPSIMQNKVSSLPKPTFLPG